MNKIYLLALLAASLLVGVLASEGSDDSGAAAAPAVPEAEGEDDSAYDFDEEDWDNWDVVPDDAQPSPGNEATTDSEVVGPATRKAKTCESHDDCESPKVCQKRCKAKCRKQKSDEECLGPDQDDLAVGVECKNDCNCGAELKCYLASDSVERCTEQIPGQHGPMCAKKCKKNHVCTEHCVKKCIHPDKASDECTDKDNGNLGVGEKCDNDCNCGPLLKCYLDDTGKAAKCTEQITGGNRPGKGDGGKLESSMIDGLFESSLHYNKEKGRGSSRK